MYKVTVEKGRPNLKYVPKNTPPEVNEII